MRTIIAAIFVFTPFRQLLAFFQKRDTVSLFYPSPDAYYHRCHIRFHAFSIIASIFPEKGHCVPLFSQAPNGADISRDAILHPQHALLDVFKFSAVINSNPSPDAYYHRSHIRFHAFSTIASLFPEKGHCPFFSPAPMRTIIAAIFVFTPFRSLLASFQKRDTVSLF